MNITKRILLVNPPVNELQHRMSPLTWTRQLGTYPPLGLMYIAAYLEKEGLNVKILDLAMDDMSYEQICMYLQDYNPDITGVSCLTFNLLSVLELVKTIKKICPGTTTVIGGPHPTIYPCETVLQSAVDYVVIGDGEEVLFRLAQDIDTPDEIPGLISKHFPPEIDTSSQIQIIDREKIPFPARHLINGKAFRAIVTRRSPMTLMVTGAGCPFNCIYCSAAKRVKPYSRGIEHVIQEMIECQQMGYKEVMFFDDIFTLDRNRIINLCKLIRQERLALSWDCRTRVDCVDSELLQSMKRAGCVRIQYGVESGSSRILKIIRKGFTTNQASKAIKITKDAGILPSVSFMIGNPGETIEDIQKTISFAVKANPAYVQFTVTTPFPFTELYQRGLQSGLYKEDYWCDFARNPSPTFMPRYWNELLSDDELQQWQNNAFRSFYFRPKYILKQLFDIQTLSEARSKISMGLGLVKEIATISS